ncbi:MAG: HEAT repeat domain-containing protein [Planctomycetes bacterium]|nr:HEAT repeat domain-containing protein [Planctomycetota bacterium]
MSPAHQPLDPRELRELERLEALAADGPIEEAQRARLDALRARLDAPLHSERLHRDLAAAYGELVRDAANLAAPEDDASFLRALEARLQAPSANRAALAAPRAFESSEPAPAPKPRRAARIFVAAALLGASGVGLWWWLGRASLPERASMSEPRTEIAGIPPTQPNQPLPAHPQETAEAQELAPRDPRASDPPLSPERLESAREAVRTALADVPPATEREAFLAALDARFSALRSEGWPLEVLVARRAERVLNAPASSSAEQREVEAALRWLALRHPESALPLLERAARDPRVQSAALAALAEAGTPRALERLAQRAQRDPGDTSAAAQALARAGITGVQRLLDLWRGEEATPQGIRVALYADPDTLDRALAERVQRERSFDRALRELAAQRGGARTREALLARIAVHGCGPQEIELAIGLGGDALLEVLLDQASSEHGARRQTLIDAVRRRLRFPAGAQEAHAVALRFAPEDDPRATILLEALAGLESHAIPAVVLALLEAPALGGVYRDHLLLALATTPPSVAPELGSELERRCTSAGPEHLAAWAAALAGQLDLDRALRFLAAHAARGRLDAALRERLEKALHAVLRAEPGLGALSALGRVQQLVQALL